jgi:NAD(P)-dependent dehydrogenase (short-subunit alcohol dehydrogenase family)
MTCLDNRVAIITGAAQGIGYGIAATLARKGAYVILWDKAEKTISQATKLEKAGFKSTTQIVDITDPKTIKDALTEVNRSIGHVDILVNNAGIAPFAPFLETTTETLDTVMGVNFYGAWNCSQAVLPAMVDRKYGRIINISSVTGPRTGDPGLSAYAASKGALSGLTRNLAVEMAIHGITVNAVLPGFIDTPLIQPLADEMGLDIDLARQRLADINPTQRLGTVADVGGICAFLASNASGYITGQEFIIDGGSTILEKTVDQGGGGF